jgi:uncharacterized protein
LDTNVWVSALLWGGKPAEIVDAAEKGKIVILASEELVEEISQVLGYLKIAKVYRDTGVTREELMETVLKIADLVKVTNKVKIVHEHPADDKVLECALASKAGFVVSGDMHLLKVGNYKKTKILTVNDFLCLID